MKLSHRTGMLAAAGVLATAFAIAPGSPAQAHDRTEVLWHSSGGWTIAKATVYNSHRSVNNCDGYADGYGTRTWYQTNTGAIGYAADTNGSASGCGAITVPSGQTIKYFQICYKPVATESCGAWFTA
jgi:hypothetical protein